MNVDHAKINCIWKQVEKIIEKETILGGFSCRWEASIWSLWWFWNILHISTVFSHRSRTCFSNSSTSISFQSINQTPFLSIKNNLISNWLTFLSCETQSYLLWSARKLAPKSAILIKVMKMKRNEAVVTETE